MTEGRLTRVDHERGRILVVEPDSLTLTAISASLDQQGHQVTMAKSEGIAQAAIEQGSFDLLLLFIPSVDAGCALATRLRSSPATEQLPVIYMMANISDAKRTQLAAHGGVFCLQVPFDPDTLIELVEKALWLPHVAQSRLKSGPDASSSKQSLQNYSDWVSL